MLRNVPYILTFVLVASCLVQGGCGRDVAKADNGQPIKDEEAQKNHALASQQQKIAGVWWCSNTNNFIRQVVYKPDGSSQEYASSPGTRVNGMPLEYTGTYSVDGDVFRYTHTSRSGYTSSGAVKIVELTKDHLVKYFQEINGKRPSGYRPPRDLTDRPGPGYCEGDDGPRGSTTGDDRLDPRQVVAREGQVRA
jgi:hypothetical protein